MEDNYNSSNIVFFEDESYFIKNHPEYASYSFQDGTFYTGDVYYSSSHHVDSFLNPVYRSRSDKYVANYNKLFSHGVDTVLLPDLQSQKMNGHIILSHRTFSKIFESYQDYGGTYLNTSPSSLDKAWFLFQRNLQVSIGDEAHYGNPRLRRIFLSM